MKKVYMILVLLFSAFAIGYAAAELQIKMAQTKSITQYIGAPIARYDLGDTECFVETSSHALFCLRK